MVVNHGVVLSVKRAHIGEPSFSVAAHSVLCDFVRAELQIATDCNRESGERGRLSCHRPAFYKLGAGADKSSRTWGIGSGGPLQCCNDTLP